jgi:hypothetical protein
MSNIVLMSLPHHLAPFSRLPRPKKASPLDPMLSTSMSFSDPTYTFSMSSNGPTNFYPWDHGDHCQHSFHVHRRTSLRWSSSTTTPSTTSVAWSVARSQVTGWNTLEGFTKSSCGKLNLVARSRLPTLERGRRSSWEPRD